MKEKGLEWTQVCLAEWSEDTVADSYGVYAIPSIFLIGSDGKILATDLRGHEIQAAGHVQACEFFGRVPRRITYDNSKVAVSQIVGKERRLTQGFLQLKSHYLFDHHFCQVARGNEKGVVEGLVKFTRLNFFVPVPQVQNLDQLNEQLRQQCLENRQRRLRGQAGTKAQLLLEDQAAFLPLPATRFEACRKVATTASSLSLVRFEPLHYLALLETKPGALDHARPLAGWTLPECFALLRQRLEAERDGEGTREYIRVLRLLEEHPPGQLRRAVEKGLAVGAITRDAIARFLYPRPDWRATLFSLDGHPHLRDVRVAVPNLSGYRELVGGAA